ncbi:MAG: sigma-70 family RNA polymerase sigma factor [Myxococcota bacterium]
MGDSGDDARLLARWRAGDEQAGRALLMRHFRPLCRFFRNKAGDSVEELIQRTMLACLENAQRLREATSFRAYLFSIARHELFAHFRRLRRDELDTSLHSVHDLQPSCGTVIARKQDEAQLLEALRRLPLELQVTLELYYWEGLRYAELAEVLGVHRETIKSRLRRAKELLRQTLAEPGGGDWAEASAEQLDDWAQALREQVGGDPHGR